MFALQYSNAQDTLKTYFDIEGNNTSQENATFYRITERIGKKTWFVNDYYINGQLQMTGSFSSKKMKKKEGHFLYYSENSLINCEGDYLKDKMEGVWKWYYCEHPNLVKLF